MIKNYFKIAFRSLFRSKLYSALNIAGLTFGVTCFLLIGLYLFDELTFDRQHADFKRIFRVVEHRKTPTEELNIAAAGYNVSAEAKKQFEEIENACRISRSGRANLENPENKNVFQEVINWADENFLRVLDFETIEGNTHDALTEPNTIVLTEDLARKLFSSTHIIGKHVVFDFFPDRPLKVTAVLKNHPRNSSFDFQSAISEATISGDTSFNETRADWASQEFLTFYLLKKDVHVPAVEQKLTKLVNANVRLEPGTTLQYSLQPIKDMHLYSENIVDGARNSNVEPMTDGALLYIKVFAIVALFVLLIACINYMNLTTARASSRSKEIGIRKANGAVRIQLIRQFLTESLLVSLISFVFAVILVNLLLPAFNEFTDKELSLGLKTDYRIWFFAFLALFITALFSGSYPALMLSRFNPVFLLRDFKLKSKGDLWLRKGLVVFQFTISVVMIVATIVIYQQVRYTNNKNLGFDKELLLVVDINSGSVRRSADAIKSEFEKITAVKNVSVTSRVPGEWKTIPTVKIKREGDTDDYSTSYLMGVDEDYFNTFNVEILQGRNFTGIADSSAVLLNETAARELGIKEAAGQMVEIPSRAFGGAYSPLRQNSPFMARIIGIVKDFHFQSLREKIAPIVLAYQYNPVHNIDYFTARITGNNIQGTLTQMNEALTKADASHLLEYHFLDEQLARFYLEDRRRQTLLIWVSLATIFIACLGLFGLATYSANQRIKEIGVRKVLGASVFHLSTLLSKDFLKLVLIANGVAFPLAWWATSTWLQEFAYHIELSWWVFVIAGVVAVSIALITVCYQAIKAAIANPIKSLRTE